MGVSWQLLLPHQQAWRKSTRFSKSEAKAGRFEKDGRKDKGRGMSASLEIVSRSLLTACHSAPSACCYMNLGKRSAQENLRHSGVIVLEDEQDCGIGRDFWDL